ncbi:Protein of unknown function [Lachnospiraceae bacterium]|nr:Protein of unknown function [Lachnospiraceae bacterium]
MQIYHYCSLETLNAILKHKTLRLTNILNSNDSAEIAWITRYLDAAFAKCYREASDQLRKYISPITLEGFVRLFTDEFFNDRYSVYRFYVTCFSDGGDVLSQWRGYADDGKGVSIGFDADMLKKICSVKTPEGRKQVSLHHIIYSEDAQKKKADKLIAALFSQLEKLFADVTTEQEALEYNDEVLEVFENTFLTLFQNSVYMKNPFFHEEREIRMCYFVLKNHMAKENLPLAFDTRLFNYNYYVKENQLVSYVDFDFSSCIDKIIRELVIGPKCITNIESMNYYLHTFGITDCTIRKSAGTYR